MKKIKTENWFFEKIMKTDKPLFSWIDLEKQTECSNY